VINKQIRGEFTFYYTNRVLGVNELIKKTYKELFQTQDLPTLPMIPSKKLYPGIYTLLLEVDYTGAKMKEETRDFLREIRQTNRSLFLEKMKFDTRRFLRKMKKFKHKPKYLKRYLKDSKE
jgi:hypothetical protein